MASASTSWTTRSTRSAVGGVLGGADVTVAAYVEAKAADGTVKWGVGLHESILTASLRAVVSAVNRHLDADDGS